MCHIVQLQLSYLITYVYLCACDHLCAEKYAFVSCFGYKIQSTILAVGPFLLACLREGL